MSMYQDDFEGGLSTPAYGSGPRPGWFRRNWLWFVPVLILTPVVCCCGGVWWGIGKVKNLKPYVDSVAAAQQDPRVQQALGSPVEVDTVLGVPNGGSFEYKMDSNGERFDAEIVLVGTNASGTLRIQGESQDGVNWTYSVREVELDDGTVIDLLPAGGPTTTTPAANDDDPDEPESDTPAE